MESIEKTGVLVLNGLFLVFIFISLFYVRVSDMTRTYSQMHRTDKYSEHSSVISKNNIRPVWPNGWVFVYKLSSSGFESSCSHFTVLPKLYETDIQRRISKWKC